MGTGKYDTLFVDFYGTLVTGDRAAVEATCRSVVEDFALPMTAPELALTWGKRFFEAIDTCNHDGFLTLFECECRTLRETLHPLVGDIDPTPYVQMLKDYWSAPPPVPDLHQALGAIKIPICVVSNADTEDILCAIERLRLPVSEVVTSQDARSYKPDPAIFQQALEKTGTDPRRVLHAGDSLHSDVGGAERMGMATCWVCYEDRILDVGTSRADYKIRNLLELRKIT